jgi:hypothetical protein
MKLGPNVAIFILFFGVALVEAFQQGNWLLAGLFLALGVMFVNSDRVKRK